MKLAPVALSVVHVGAGGHAGTHRCRSNPNILQRSNSVRRFRNRCPSGDLVARWHVSPETGQLKCHWSPTNTWQTIIYGPVCVEPGDAGTGRAALAATSAPSLVSHFFQQTCDLCDLTAPAFRFLQRESFPP